jgi:hypothetical protein
MKNQMGQLMRFGAKFQKNYPWSNWWSTARKGCLQSKPNALAYVQTRLPLATYSTHLTIGGLASHELWLSFDGTFSHMSQGWWLGDNCWQSWFTQLTSQLNSCHMSDMREIMRNYHYPLVTAGLAWVWYLDARHSLLSAMYVYLMYSVM